MKNKPHQQMKFFQQIGCEHGWLDSKGFAHCSLGTSCSIGFNSYCVKEDCPIYEKNDTPFQGLKWEGLD